MAVEAWLRGPLEGVDPYLMPAAHALVQAIEEVEQAALGLTTEELWATPGGAASVGFHLRHIAGSTDRLLAYARGEALTEQQRAAAARERDPGDPPADAPALVRAARLAVDEALRVLRATPRSTLLQPRAVGAKLLPSSVLGLLGHVAEHTTRHAGQIVTTTKIVRGWARVDRVG